MLIGLVAISQVVLPLGLVFYIAVVYRRLRHLPPARRALKIVMAICAALLAFVFYQQYLRWEGCLHDLGQCYASKAGRMTGKFGMVWGGLTTLFMVLFFWSLWRFSQLLNRK